MTKAFKQHLIRLCRVENFTDDEIIKYFKDQYQVEIITKDLQ